LVTRTICRLCHENILYARPLDRALEPKTEISYINSSGKFRPCTRSSNSFASLTVWPKTVFHQNGQYPQSQPYGKISESQMPSTHTISRSMRDTSHVEPQPIKNPKTTADRSKQPLDAGSRFSESPKTRTRDKPSQYSVKYVCPESRSQATCRIHCNRYIYTVSRTPTSFLSFKLCSHVLNLEFPCEIDLTYEAALSTIL